MSRANLDNDGKLRVKLYHFRPSRCPSIASLSWYSCFFAKNLPNPTILNLINLQAGLHQRRLEVYLAILLPKACDPQASRDEVLARLTLDLGITIEHAYLAWLAEAAKIVRDLKPED